MDRKTKANSARTAASSSSSARFIPPMLLLRTDSLPDSAQWLYEPGLRTGAWMKMRVNRGQEFVIGGYTRGTKTFDALIFGYYEGDKLIYVARTRNGFTPVTRAQLFRKFKGLEMNECPFANLPEARSGRWGQGLTKAKMAECQWLKPVLVGQFEFLEWTGDNHLRHSKFVGLREDKKASDVRRDDARRSSAGR